HGHAGAVQLGAHAAHRVMALDCRHRDRFDGPGAGRMAHRHGPHPGADVEQRGRSIGCQRRLAGAPPRPPGSPGPCTRHGCVLRRPRAGRVDARPAPKPQRLLADGVGQLGGGRHRCRRRRLALAAREGRRATPPAHPVRGAVGRVVGAPRRPGRPDGTRPSAGRRCRRPGGAGAAGGRRTHGVEGGRPPQHGCRLRPVVRGGRTGRRLRSAGDGLGGRHRCRVRRSAGADGGGERSRGPDGYTAT
ncbi:uncharacterized protein METZ01_LOCUS473934, partial [marine metagenome]